MVPFSLPPALEAVRLDHVDNSRLGVPAHVTLLFPFVPVVSLGDSDIGRAAAVIKRSPAFEVAFREARFFEPGATKEGVVWLAPEPPDPFIDLTEALAAAFPGFLPYQGLHDTVIPHLTLANVAVDVAATTAAAGQELPFTRSVDAAALLVEDDRGRWRIERRLPLG